MDFVVGFTSPALLVRDVTNGTNDLLRRYLFTSITSTANLWETFTDAVMGASDGARTGFVLIWRDKASNAQDVDGRVYDAPIRVRCRILYRNSVKGSLWGIVPSRCARSTCEGDYGDRQYSRKSPDRILYRCAAKGCGINKNINRPTWLMRCERHPHLHYVEENDFHHLKHWPTEADLVEKLNPSEQKYVVKGSRKEKRRRTG